MAKRGLIVDDIPFVRQMIARILTDARYMIIGEAADGNEALEEYAKLEPDFVTMDVVMPKKNGIETCRAIIEKYPTAKIIMVSALDHEQILTDSINAGARDFLMKPFAPDDLINSVARLFNDEEEEEPKQGKK